MYGIRICGIILLWSVLCSCHLEDIGLRKSYTRYNTAPTAKTGTTDTQESKDRMQPDRIEGREGTYTLDINMPSVHPQQDDAYLCTSAVMTSNTRYIINYEAMAVATKAHHILLYGCEMAGSSNSYWGCDRICRDAKQPKILYAWAKNAPPTHLPPDVGYKVGGRTGIKVLVLQIHYRWKIPNTDPGDHSGVHLTLTSTRQKYIAGIFILMRYSLNIPPMTKGVHGDVSCRYIGETPLHPFAFRVHAHSLSTVISAYQNNGTWSLIGKGNPQWPQAFYPVNEELTIKPGDLMFARCTYDSTRRSRNTSIGGSHSDEMCNFYLMYYTEVSDGKPFFACANNDYEAMFDTIPPGNDVPLPPNPALEEDAEASILGNDVHNSGGPDIYDRISDAIRREGTGRISAPILRSGYLGRYDDADDLPNGYDYYGDLNDGNNEHNPDYFYYEVQHQRSRNRNRRPNLDRSGGGIQDLLGYGRGHNNNNQAGTGSDGAHAFFGFPDETVKNNIAPTYKSDQWDWRDPGYRTNIYAHEHGMYRGSNRNPSGELGNFRNPGIGSNTNLYPNRQMSQPFGGGAPSDGPVNQGGGVSGAMRAGSPGVRVSSTTSPAAVATTTTASVRGDQTTTNPSRVIAGGGASGSDAQNKEVSSLPLRPSAEETVHWPVIMPTDNLTIGQVSGLATDSHGNIHMFHRGSRVWNQDSFDKMNRFQKVSEGAIKENTIVTFSPSGKVIKQWGANMFYMPHGLHIDQEDNLWVTDVALHQVMKFEVGSTTPTLTLGTRLTPGSGDQHFCKPTDVATLKTGEFFITDGYCNHRVIKYTKNATVIKEWGEQTKSVTSDNFPAPYAFANPHSITALEDHSLVCVADRENGRIQCFTFDGVFVKQLHPKEFNGRLFAVSYSPVTGVLYAVNGPDLYNKNVPVLGFSLNPSTGALLETWAPHQGLHNPHGLAISPQGDFIYVGELDPHKIWRLFVSKHYVQEHKYKKGVHPQTRPVSVDGSTDADTDEDVAKEETKGESDLGASMVIGALLVIPVIIIVAVTAFMRLRKSGKFSFLTTLMYKKSRNRRFNLGTFLSRHKGFNRLNTDEGSDHEYDHLNSDSDVEEYSATTRKA